MANIALLASNANNAEPSQEIGTGNAIINAINAGIPINNNAGVTQYTSAASFAANASVATVLGSVGPTGSHTTVQKWLTITDNTGTQLWIPCF